MKAKLNELNLTVAVLGLSTALAGAQPTSAPPAAAPVPPVAAAASTNVPGPRIQFATPMYDFGRVKSGDPVKYTYVFTNTGEAMLVINSVQPQCGCTAAGEWTKQVEPGKTGSIPIQFNTVGYGGPVFKQVTVTCNVTNQPMLFLQLKGTVYKPYEIVPALAVINVAPDAEGGSVVVTITNNVEEPLFLFSAESNNRMLSAQLITNQPGKGYQLTVTTVPPLATGSIQGQISMKTSWTNPAVIPVTVVVNCQPAVMVIPSYITLMPGRLPNAITNSVTIQNNSTNLLTLSDPVVNVPGVEAQIKETQPGKTFTAMLGFPQGFEITPGQPVELTIKTSHPKFPTVKVAVMQMPRPQPPAPPTPPPPVIAPAPSVKPAPAVAPASPAPAALPTPSLPPAPVKRVSTFPRRPSVPPPLPPGLNPHSALTVIPARVRLAPGPLPNAVTNSVVILNNSTNLLHLSEPVLNAPGAQTQIRETQPGKSFTVMMAFPEGFQIRPGQHVELSVSTSDPKSPVVKVPVIQLPQSPVAVQPAPSVPPGPVVAPTPSASGPPASPAAPDKAGIRLPAEGTY
jgi:hypothetical protein